MHDSIVPRELVAASTLVLAKQASIWPLVRVNGPHVNVEIADRNAFECALRTGERALGIVLCTLMHGQVAFRRAPKVALVARVRALGRVHGLTMACEVGGVGKRHAAKIAGQLDLAARRGRGRVRGQRRR